MSATRDKLNLRGLLQVLGGKPPPREVAQPLEPAALAGGGGGLSRPIDWASPDTSLRLYAQADNASSRIVLSETCGSQILIKIDAAGAALIRVIDCAGDGVKLDPTGLSRVHVTGAGTEAEVETITEAPLGWITVTGCVNGVNRSIRVLGEVLA